MKMKVEIIRFSLRRLNELYLWHESTKDEFLSSCDPVLMYGAMVSFLLVIKMPPKGLEKRVSASQCCFDIHMVCSSGRKTRVHRFNWFLKYVIDRAIEEGADSVEMVKNEFTRRLEALKLTTF